MHVVVTAGHVDHGKSTLVRALTGQDPDRLEEEQKRGLSIQLGYCWATWDEVGDVAFVDVPGHERFLATTLSGMGPVPVVLFVVAADDPWMPQSAEHLAALDALGVRHGLLVVTRSDLADPAPAMQRACAELAATGLAGIDAVAVSGRTGKGLDELRRALVRVLTDVPAPRPDSDVRLWVDRRFSVAGTGTVVTGTLPAGTVRIADTLEVDGRTVRVRTLETLGARVDAVSGPARVALGLAGRAAERLARDSVLVAPGVFRSVTVVDVQVPQASALPERPLLHVGSVATAVHARPLGGEHARLALGRPLPLRYGDRAVLRDPGDRRLWGIEVLDVDPPRIRRRGVGARVEQLCSLDGSVAAELVVRGLVRRDDLRVRGVGAGPVPPGTIETAGWLMSRERADVLAAALSEEVAARPQGTTAAAAAVELGLPDARLVEELVRPPLSLTGGRIAVADASDPTDRTAPLLAWLSEHAFQAPDAATLDGLGLDPDDLAALGRNGTVLRLAPRLVLAAGTDEAAVTVLSGLEQPFTVSEARSALGTSRRVALALLDHLDRTGATTRLVDDRRRVRRTSRP
jgi:selenocysteine-specific elongation factor